MTRAPRLRIALAQVNTTVGDLDRNRRLIEETYAAALEAGAALIVFPELTLTGYPPEDLLLKPSFVEDTRATLRTLVPRLQRGLVVVGCADQPDLQPRNSAAIIGAGRLLDVYHKCTLPNYGVFDEKRYFVPGTRCPVYHCGPWRIAVNICEDMWVPAGVPHLQRRRLANLMINISASPFHAGKGRLRESLVCGLASAFSIPVLHVNLVGGQDELVFDGQSVAAGGNGALLARAPQFAPHLLLVDLEPRPAKRLAPNTTLPESPVIAEGAEIPPFKEVLRAEIVPLPETLLAPPTKVAPPRTRAAFDAEPFLLLGGSPDAGAVTLNTIAHNLESEEEIYLALMLGLRDYVTKNGFRGVVLGLSGGIDSALTATIAADALGSDAVVVLSMPSRFTSAGARDDARELARRLKLTFHEIPIDSLFAAFLSELRSLLAGRPPDVTEENIQARIRGLILMAYSNKFGHLVLATGNKSEVAVGYCTLYGDMVGGFSVLKDVLKTQVGRLARWRNARTPEHSPIPQATIDRPPSAELRADQRDTDSLPPYDLLDPIVSALVESDLHPRDLVAAGFPRETADRVFAMIQGNEYKRRQAAPGIKITPRAFGRDRRYPLTNRYRPRAGRES